MKIEKLEYHSTSNDGFAFVVRPNIVDITDKINEIIDKLNEIEEAEPIRHGKWIWVEDVPLEEGQSEYDREAWYQCSECDAYDLRLKDCHSDYCWSCGAKMDLDEVNDEVKDT